MIIDNPTPAIMAQIELDPFFANDDAYAPVKETVIVTCQALPNPAVSADNSICK